MIKINKPSRVFKAKALFRYKGTNAKYFLEKRFEKIIIFEIDYNLHEELIVKQTMLDGTQIMFSMISNNMYFKENSYYEKKGEDNYCDFQLYYDDNIMVFEGSVSYLNYVNENYEYREYFETNIILPFNKYLFDVWVKHDKFLWEN